MVELIDAAGNGDIIRVRELLDGGINPDIEDRFGRIALIDASRFGHTQTVKNLVIKQAKLARKANLDALVCSAHEVSYIKHIFQKEIITPGIRLNTKMNDQKRVMTPKKAFEQGSNWLVIGRSLTKGNIKNNIKNLIDHLN